MISLNLLDLAFLAPKGLPPQNLPGDDFEIYTVGANVDGLNMGWCGNLTYDICWSTPYSARAAYTGTQARDYMEVYTVGADVDGLNNGTGFSSAYAAHSY